MSKADPLHGEPIIASIRSLEVPPGWAMVSVGQVGDVRLGRQRSPKNRSSKYPTKYLRAANITWAGLDLTDVLDMDFKPVELQNYRLQLGDVLLSEASGSAKEVGKSAIWNAELSSCCFQNTVIRFRPRLVSPNYALVAFQHFARNGVFARVAKGVGIHHLSADRFASMPFLLPPENEQRRIVEKIEELLSDLNAGVVALERAKANLKRYRAAVLKAAVEGNGDHSQRVYDKRPLGDLIGEIGQGWSPRCELNRDPLPHEWAIIKTTAVQSMAYQDTEAKPLPATFTPRPEIEIVPGDMLMTRKGPRQRAGVACLVRATRPRLMVCDTVYRFRTKSDTVLPAYLELALNSPTVVAEIDKRKAGINDSGVSLTHGKLRSVSIPVPSMTVQEAIVSEVEEKLSQIEVAETGIERSLDRAARLRQSVLKQAFEGKIVAQNLVDEPASVLLSRINALREPKAIHESKSAAVPEKNAKRVFAIRTSIISYTVRRLGSQPSFGRTQLEKTLHLAQCHLGIDMDFQFERYAAGPFDKAIFKLEGVARKNSWFTTHKRPNFGVTYKPGSKIEAICKYAPSYFGAKHADMDRLLDHIVSMNTDQAELFATAYAAWNDLVIDGRSADDKAIIAEVHGWHPDKLRFKPPTIRKCLDWMRTHGYVPTGQGPRTAVATKKPKSTPKRKAKATKHRTR